MKCGVRPKDTGTSYTLVRVIHTPTTFLLLLINIFKYLSAFNPIHYYKNIKQKDQKTPQLFLAIDYLTQMVF
jgi:hypothetical protein